jgi:hypothetical protein
VEPPMALPLGMSGRAGGSPCCERTMAYAAFAYGRKSALSHVLTTSRPWSVYRPPMKDYS